MLTGYCAGLYSIFCQLAWLLDAVINTQRSSTSLHLFSRVMFKRELGIYFLSIFLRTFIRLWCLTLLNVACLRIMKEVTYACDETFNTC